MDSEHQTTLDRCVSGWIKEHGGKPFNSVIFRTDLVQSLVDTAVEESQARLLVNEYLLGLVKDRAAKLYVDSIP